MRVLTTRTATAILVTLTLACAVLAVRAADAPVAPTVPAEFPVPVNLAAPIVADEDHAAHQHKMSAEDLAVLRRKIPLYQQYSDDRINESMSRMHDLEAYISPASVHNRIGVLALGHGYGEPGNNLFQAAFRPVAAKLPTAASLGMAMMSSSHVQAAVDDLEKAGATIIVVLPAEIGDDTSLIRQWNYIFDRTNESAYLDVPRVHSKAQIVVAKTPTTSPLVGEILADYARSAVKEPTKEAALLIAHGPEEAADNDKLLKILEDQAAKVQQATGLSVVHFDSLQDDAPTAVRTANVKRMRDWIKDTAAGGKKVIVLQVIMTSQGGVTQRIRRDLEGLKFELVDKGIAEHPLFDRWIQDTVATAVTIADLRGRGIR